MIRTVLVPRRRSSRAARLTVLICAGSGRALARRLSPGPAGQVLDLCGPVSLVLLVLVWAGGVAAGGELLRFAAGDGRLAGEVRAGTGLALLLVLGAFVVLLNRITAAYERRERPLSRLMAEVPFIADTDTVLALCIGSTSRTRIDQRFEQWAEWFSDVEFTHLSYPALAHFRPAGDMSWTKAATIALDSAALLEAMAPAWAPYQTRLLLRCGTSCLERLSQTLGIAPPSDGPSLQGREESSFTDALRYATTAGLAPEREYDQIWSAFQGLRRRYAPHVTTVCHSLMYDIDRQEYRGEPAPL